MESSAMGDRIIIIYHHHYRYRCYNYDKPDLHLWSFVIPIIIFISIINIHGIIIIISIILTIIFTLYNEKSDCNSKNIRELSNVLGISNGFDSIVMIIIIVLIPSYIKNLTIKKNNETWKYY